MVNIIDFLKGLVSKTYKFFAPSVKASSTAIDESVVVELSRQTGTNVQAVTNGLGKCVGYTSSNVAAVANGESKVIGTVIDFSSRQVVVTEELLANQAVAGGARVAVGSTVTEISATTSTTAMLGTTVAGVGACVVAAIGGYSLGKTVGDYLAEKYPDFWVDTCGKALYEAGCTIGSDVNSVITYLKPDGSTYIPQKAQSIIKSELSKIGALSSVIDFSDKASRGVTPLINFTVSWVRSGYINEKFVSQLIPTFGDKMVLYRNGNNAVPFSLTTSNFIFNRYYEVWSYDKCDGAGNDVVTNSINFTLVGNSSMQNLNIICNVPIFASQSAASKYLNGGEMIASDFHYIPSNVYYPPTPSTIPTPVIRVNDAPATDEDSKVVPVPGIEPATDTPSVPKPGIDPVKNTDPVAENPTPFPAPVPIPGYHVPDVSQLKPKTPEDPVIPAVPSMVASALSRVFNPTQAQLDALGQYMWSSSRPEDLLKLFQNPSDGVISLHGIYGTPSIGSAAEIKLGYLPTGVSASVVTSQFVVIDCGTITIDEKYNNATDYAPYTTIQIYLPFIGIQGLNPFDIVGSTIKCTYKIDVYTGACIAQLTVKREGLNGVIYEFAGNCSYQIPLTSGNYIQVLANVIGGAIGGAVIGNAPGAAIGAGRALLHSNADVSRSGNLSANAGILGTRIPYIIITRSIPKDAYQYSSFYGYPSNKTILLSDCIGFTRVKDIILHTSATQEERDEILKLLKTGIYI